MIPSLREMAENGFNRIYYSSKAYTVCKNRFSFDVKYTHFWKTVNNNTWEPYTFRIFDYFLDNNHPFIDIGAWIGPTALYGSHLASHCFAIEPDPYAYAELLHNISLNSALSKKITCSRLCIGPTCGNAILGTHTRLGDSMSSIIFSESHNSVAVQSLTFDEYCKQTRIENYNFIKMDIEGGEEIVLPTMIRALKSNRPTLHISLHPHLFSLSGDLDTITGVLDIYDYIYMANGTIVTPEDVLQHLHVKEGFDIVASDIQWNID